MKPAKDKGQRDLEKRRERGEHAFCVACNREVMPGDRFTWAKAKNGKLIYLCGECADREGVNK